MHFFAATLCFFHQSNAGENNLNDYQYIEQGSYLIEILLFFVLFCLFIFLKLFVLLKAKMVSPLLSCVVFRVRPGSKIQLFPHFHAVL